MSADGYASAYYQGQACIRTLRRCISSVTDRPAPVLIKPTILVLMPLAWPKLKPSQTNWNRWDRYPLSPARSSARARPQRRLRNAGKSRPMSNRRWPRSRLQRQIFKLVRTGSDRPCAAGGVSLRPSIRSGVNRVVAALLALKTTTVVTSHFIAINVAVGAATQDDRVICFEPDNCSCTRLEVGDGRLRLVELGRQRETRIL